MRVAVYDRYWGTAGGGEKFAAGIAAALTGEHQVTLLAHESLDLDWLGERLQLDLSGVDRVEQVAADRAGAVAEATAGYDLFVNASFLSRDSNRAGRGVYVVHFPGFRPSGLHRRVGQVAGALRARLLDRGVQVSLGDGFHAPEPGRLHTVHWTGGQAELLVRGTGRVVVTVLLGRQLPSPVAPMEVTAEVDGRVVGRTTLDAAGSRLDRLGAVPLTFEAEVPAGHTTRVVLRSPAWVPRHRGIGTDPRQLGVPVVGWHGGTGWRRRLASALPLLATEQGERFGQLDSYDVVLANSRYTQGWVQRMWGRPCEVLYPPVTLVPRQPKRRIVLSVGRFFVPGTGHNKKQLEMVRAFRRLVATGGPPAEGVEYHLVGGCAPEHQSYLDQVQAEAQGLPVVLHPNATGAQLRDLYGQATIFWHAAGLGEDPDRHPERYEHFGITTVEAMSAGAVPVVIDAAGQTEIVDHGVSGYRFGDLDELVRYTRRLLADDEQRDKMSRAAEERARTFGWDAFVGHVRNHVVG